MKVCALDLSTSTGWAILEKQDSQIKLLSYGPIKLQQSVESFGEYPHNYVAAAEYIADRCEEVILANPDIESIAIEMTNKGQNRHSQRQLEWVNYAVLKKIQITKLPIFYIDTGEWRGRSLGLSVAKTKKMAKPFIKEYESLKKQLESFIKTNKGSKDISVKAQKKALEESLESLKESMKLKCIFGKIDRKSISVAYVNMEYGLNLAKGENDISDAICLGTAFLKGCKVNTNFQVFGHESRERKKNEQEQ